MRAIVFLSILAVSIHCSAASCPEHFFQGQVPSITSQAMQPRTRELCFEAFAVLHSGLTRTPLYSAEHLTRDRVDAAANLPRINTFHPETRLPPADRSTLADYKASGYDRGHMSPNHDMPTASAQQESFSLANMVPQARKINQNLWEGIESAVRDAVKPGTGVYVITGPLFEGKSLEQLNDCVLVPTSVFKLVYFPDSHRGAAYVATNAKDATTVSYDVVSIAELERRAGINLMPGLTAAEKQARAELPAPEIHGHGRVKGEPKPKRSRKSESTWIVQ